MIIYVRLFLFEKTLQNGTKFQIIPRRYMIGQRLAQCKIWSYFEFNLCYLILFLFIHRVFTNFYSNHHFDSIDSIDSIDLIDVLMVSLSLLLTN